MKTLKWLMFILLPIPCAMLMGLVFTLAYEPLGWFLSGAFLPLAMYRLAPGNRKGNTICYTVALALWASLGVIYELMERKPSVSTIMFSGMIVGLAVVCKYGDRILRIKPTTGGQGTAGAC